MLYEHNTTCIQPVLSFLQHQQLNIDSLYFKYNNDNRTSNALNNAIVNYITIYLCL